VVSSLNKIASAFYHTLSYLYRKRINEEKP